MLLQGIRICTGPQDYDVVKELQLARFDGARWLRFGEMVRR